MMEVTKVLTSVFVLCLSGPTFGYPFTHSNLFSANGGTGPRGQQDQQQQLPAHLEEYLANRGSQQQAQQQQQQLPTHLEDYLANYVQGAQQYQQPQYQPAYQQQQQQGYIAQVPQQKLTAETLAALLPYLSSSSSSLNSGSAAAMASANYDYPEYPAAAAEPAYTDNDGTWYDDMAQQQIYNNEPTQQDEEQVVLQLLLDHLNGRYSLDDLAALEREAEIEENTESQLQSLMNKKMVKKSTFPALEAGHSGQKEEAPLMPATSVRRPVWGQQQQAAKAEASNMNQAEVKRSSDGQGLTLVADTVLENTENKVSDSSSSSSSSSSSTAASTSSSTTTTTSTILDDSSNSADSSADSAAQGPEETTMTPRLQNAYDALKKYLDRERKFRQEQDDLADMSELTEPSRGIQKRFAPDEDSLSQQLANLKKTRS